ncbi:MAG: hypothetical protein J0647_02585 [Campylobacteraceae bacterium]|nr:hypothetical protein [Campylobacteraceae bacterium]
MTCAAVNVYNKKLLDDADFPRYYNSSFIQTGVIFEFISNKDFNIQWIQKHSITSLKYSTLRKTNWSYTPKAFEIGCEDWINFVMSLSLSYKLENKMKCIMDFGKVSALFSLNNLIVLRILGLLNKEVVKKYKKLLPLTIDYPSCLIFAIAITPKVVFKILAISIIFVFKRDKINKISVIWNR